MNWFKRRFLVLFASVAVLGVIGAVGIPWLYGGIFSEDASRPGLGIALAAPLLQTEAFPEDSAGFSAYLDVGSAIDDIDDLGAVGTACTTVPAFSQTHVLCQVDDNDLALVNIFLYADTNGLVVAYLAGNQPTSRAAVWSGDESLPGTTFQPGFESPTLALDEIVKRAVERVGVDYESEASNTGYFHWGHPVATVLTVMTKTENTGTGKSYFFSRPNDPLFEASVTAYGQLNFGVGLNGVNIEAAQSVYRDARRSDDHIDLFRVPPDALHRVFTATRNGSAIYLLWTPSP